MLIRRRITLAALGVTVVVALTLAIAAYLAQRAAEARFVEVSLSGKQVLLEQLLQRHASEMAAFTKALTRDSITLEALRKGDSAVLREQILTTHNLFYSDGSLDRMQLFDPEGNYLASQPQDFNGRTAKPLVRMSAEKAVTVHGLSRDDDGVLQAILAFPLYVRGKLRAVAVYGRDFQRIVDDIQRSDGADVFVVDVGGRQMLEGSENQRARLTQAPGDRSAGSLEVEHDAGRYHAVAHLPLADDAGQPMGLLSISRDETDTYRVQAVAKYTSVAVVLVILVASAVALFWYVRRAFRPIENVVASMSAVANGDLTVQMDRANEKDETGRLVTAMSLMAEHLRSLVTDVADTANALTGAAAGLRQVTTESNAVITRQSEETDQVATAVNQMSTNVQQVANHAGEAAEASNEMAARAGEGQAVVSETIEAINGLAREIEQAGTVVAEVYNESKNVEAVLDVIHSVSEQTNLLALNAAIEAARAGEQGRGFAVVADEVRTLASRTRASTEEIQQMISRLQAGAQRAVDVIGASRRSSQATVERAGTAGESLAAITASVERSNGMNRQIAHAAEEQRTVADMINRSVAHIAQLAESSRAQTAATDTAAESVSQLSDRLITLIQRFKLTA